MRLSRCGRFRVLDVLFLDREVGDALAAWAGERGLRAEEAVQLAVAALVVDQRGLHDTAGVVGTRPRTETAQAPAEADARFLAEDRNTL